MDFEAQIKATLNINDAKATFEQFKASVQNETIKIKLGVDQSTFNTSSITKQIQSVYANAGTTAGKSYGTALQTQINTVAKTQRNAFSQPLNNMNKQQQSYIDWWQRQLADYEKRISGVSSKVSDKSMDLSIAKISSKYDSYKDIGYSTKSLDKEYYKIQKLQGAITELNSRVEKGTATEKEKDAMVRYYGQLESSMKKAKNEIGILNEQYGKPITAEKAWAKSNEVQNYLNKNTKATKQYGDQLKQLSESFKTVKTQGEFDTLNNQYKNLKSEINLKGLTGNSIISELGRGFKQIGQFAMTYGGIQKVVRSIVDSVNQLKEVDSIITEISKTSDLTNSQLKELANNSFDAASKYGKTATDYLTGIQEMSRSGFYGKKAEGLAELSILGQAAGDMSADVSNSYLLATNAAYEYQGSVEKLNAVLDGQNMITNRNSVSMNDMAEATSKAASMASQTGVQVDELSAIIGTAVSRTKQDGNEIGTALKSLFVNLQDTSNKKIVSTFDALGISQTKLVNGSKQLKTPIELLKELADAYNNLEEGSALKADVLRNIGNKRQANVLAAILSGISSGDYDKMIQDYSQGTGSAAEEAAKSANNWEGSLNRLSNAWIELMSNFANSDAITGAVNALASLVNGIDDLVGTLGAIPTVGGLAGAFFGMKNAGKLYFAV